MKNKTGILIFLLVFSMMMLKPEDDRFKYFRMDKIVDVSGKIVKIRMEERYEKSSFVVIELRESKTDILYDIEVSPKWFYRIDVAEGSIVNVKGSLNSLKDKKLILAQTIIFEGELYNFRDKFGFPLWRGEREGFGKKKWKGERRKKGKE